MILPGVIAASGGISIPPIPSSANAVLIASVLGNWRPVEYAEGEAFHANSASGLLLPDTPYAVNWNQFINNSEPPPYLLDDFYDQSPSANSLTQTGAARSTLQVTTPVDVTGLGAGHYLYSGLDGSGYSYYNLTGHPNSLSNYVLYANQDDALWEINGAAGSFITQSDGLSFKFAWLDSWTGSTVTQGTGSGEIVGASGCGLVGSGPLFPLV